MKIEAGKYYRTRGGHVVGPIETTENFGPYTFWVGMDEDFCWTPDGAYGNKPHDNDLISEVYVSDTPPADGANTFRNCTVGTYAPEAKTLRDEFAMAALTGMMADHTAPNKPPEFFADLAYKYANAMMEARKK